MTAPVGGVVRGSARANLINALGELVLDMAAPVPTSALVGALAEVDVETHAARQAIARCARSGLIEGARQGRESRWSVTPRGREVMADGVQRVEMLGRPIQHWDGRWLVLVSSIPQDRRSVRQKLYRALEWAGCGSPSPGLWVCAHAEREPLLRETVARLGLDATTLSWVGTTASVGVSEEAVVAAAWDLPRLAETYHRAVEQFEALRPESPRAAFRSLLLLDEALQSLPAQDPHLPEALTPRWEGRALAGRLLDLRRQWRPPAQEHWRTLVARP